MSSETIETVIRNYQGKLPPGIWACSECDFSSANLQEAAAHAETTQLPHGHWVYLFAKLSGSEPALFEMHDSDMGGVYLNSCTGMLSYRDLKR